MYESKETSQVTSIGCRSKVSNKRDPEVIKARAAAARVQNNSKNSNNKQSFKRNYGKPKMKLSVRMEKRL